MTTLPTSPPPERTLDVVAFSVTEDGPGIGGMPRLVVSLSCRRPDCDTVYVLAADRPLQALGHDAFAAGWTRHPSLGPVCPDHPWKTPQGALPASEAEAHRDRQAVLETAEIPVADPGEHVRVREEGLDSGAYLITCSCGEKYATEVWADEHAAVLAEHARHVAAATETRPDETTDKEDDDA